MARAPFGVYVHVPYCRQHCLYCDFNIHVMRSREPPWKAFVAAIGAELAARAPVFAGARAGSVYFGGGTPSLMPAPVVVELLGQIDARIGIEPTAEITLEVDPGTTSMTHLRDCCAAGVNRISLGWQSTDDALLVRLGRGHDARLARETFALARDVGCGNMSIDLIFAVPGQSLADLDADLDAIGLLGPEHVSLYALTFHRRTMFHKLRARGELFPVDDDTELAMMEKIDRRLAALGYARYEVSNYARTGARSRHNMLYWTGAPYLGLGPGAHSFAPRDAAGGWRWEGTRRPWRYIERWQRGDHSPGIPTLKDGSVSFVESLTARQLLAERMMCAMRLCDGIDLAGCQCGPFAAEINLAAAEAARRGWLRIAGSHLTPTAEGLRFSDSLAELFF